MKVLKYLALTGFATICFLSAPQKSTAQVSFSVQIGPEPACPYGYYDYAPYRCAPYGYYGPEWFSNGIFVGSGPWYHGHDHFRGHVDRRFDPRNGYHGSLPEYNERGDWDRHHGRVEHFRGRDWHEEHGDRDPDRHHDDH
jgi:hypothetical protein